MLRVVAIAMTQHMNREVVKTDRRFFFSRRIVCMCQPTWIDNGNGTSTEDFKDVIVLKSGTGILVDADP